MAIRIGIDIGGTFTDVVMARDGSLTSAKVLTTAAAPAEGVLHGLTAVLAGTGIGPGDVDLIIHGTTLATNAIIERKGARTAFVTTAGHRDVLEIRSEDRFDLYDLEIRFPQPLVPRELRFEVSERMDSRGRALLPLDEAGLRRVAERISSLGVESIAVGFLHSYANPAHERQAAALIEACLPGVSLSLSSEVSAEMREYERFSTVCANAYVRPKIEAYLTSLRTALARTGFRCPLLLMLSSGGLSTLETAARYPVRLVESGPAGGAVFASRVARTYGLGSSVSFDMGGTTAKICLIEHGVAQTSRSFEAARSYRFRKGSGLPLRIPVVELVEIGAGGGSIAWLDDLGRLTVGPDSAGSDPGPAAYGMGGTRPTVTDADLCLGRLDPARFAGGRIRLDVPAATSAMRGEIADRLGGDAVLASCAVSELVEENMANAARVHAIEQGRSLAGAVLIAFGGAAGLHVGRLAEKIGIDRFIVPRFAGVGSALGFLQADVSFDVVRSFKRLLATLVVAELRALLDEMRVQASATLGDAAGEGALQVRALAYMRYVGQGHEVRVDLAGWESGAHSVATLAERFATGYSTVYSRTVPEGVVELVACSVTVSARAAYDDGPPPALPSRGCEPTGMRLVHSLSQPAGESIRLYWRTDLEPGVIVDGPAIIAEDETSVLLPAGFTAAVDAYGALDCRRGGEPGPIEAGGPQL